MGSTRVCGLVLASALGASAGVATADPAVEIGAYGGARWFSANNQLGNSEFPDQVPGDGGVTGLRLAWLALPHLLETADGSTRLQLAFEGEGSYMFAHIGSSRDSNGLRPRFAASILGARGQLALRLAHFDAVPHLVIGGGTESIHSRSPYAADETDPVVYYGVGATVPAMAGFEFRFDVRHGFMPSREADHWTSTLEVQLGIQVELGGTYRRPKSVHVAAPPAEAVVVIADTPPPPPPPYVPPPPSVDVPPSPPPVDPDPDHDGVLAAADQCPAEAEVRNGWKDGDGCADSIPVTVAKAFDLVATVKFEKGKARVTAAGKTILNRVMKELDSQSPPGGVHLVVTGHPDETGTDATLASKRAEAVKWYLVDQGFVATRVDVATGGSARQAVTLSLFQPVAPAR